MAPMKKIQSLIKKEIVTTIALIIALLSAFIIPPDKKYADYVDFRVLALLFCLMLIVKAFQKMGLFDLLINQLFKKVASLRFLVLLHILICFFSSMLITNDVALITFVPFAMLSLRLCRQENQIIRVVVLQTIAANLGSMCTPIGNPQNLYLFSVSGMPLANFFKATLPITILSLFLLILSVLMFPPVRITKDVKIVQKKIPTKDMIVYLILFGINLLVVFRILSWIPALIITILGVLILRQFQLFAKVDYALLLSFVGFFIFVGNLGRIPAISELLKQLIEGREILLSVVCSQFLSNVPAAILLSEFTDKYEYLIQGINIGGLGTLIASMASLISYKLYAGGKGAKKGTYLLTFTGYSCAFLAVLLTFCSLIQK